MKVEIKITEYKGEESVLVVLLHTKKWKSFDGLYRCAYVVPETREELLSFVETGINACLQNYEREKEDNAAKEREVKKGDI